jgi:hypothetical protein
MHGMLQAPEKVLLAGSEDKQRRLNAHVTTRHARQGDGQIGTAGAASGQSCVILDTVRSSCHCTPRENLTSSLFIRCVNTTITKRWLSTSVRAPIFKKVKT